MPRDDEGDIIDAKLLKHLETYDLVSLINRRGTEVLEARENLLSFDTRPKT